MKESVIREGVKAALLHPDQVGVMWDEIAPALEEVEGFDELWTTEFVYNGILRGDFQLWAFGEESDRSARLMVITRVVDYPKKKVIEITWCFGRDVRRYIERMVWMLETFAEMLGASEIRAEGRAGWARLLKGEGVRVSGMIYRKVVGVKELH